MASRGLPGPSRNNLEGVFGTRSPEGFFDLIDRIVCLDVGARGVAGLYEPARTLVRGSMAGAAAERRLIELSPSAGLVDGMTGLLDATVDGMHPNVHASIVHLLEQTVRRALQ